MNARHHLVVSPTRRAALKRLYGLTEEDLLALLEIVGYRCPVCLRPFKAAMVPNVDHSHDDGLVFGPLCTRENVELFGRFGRDPAFYRRAADFLENPPAAALPGERRRAPGAAPQ